MQETENIKLQKPSENEYINLQTLNDNADKVDAEFGKVENPPFDDSGTVQEISSFTDFVNSVKTKMNIFQFFRDFKAGMKYVLHAGRLANNAVTTEEGFALDARMGKVLQDQILDVNKNINSKFPETKKSVMGAGWYRFAKFKGSDFYGGSGNSVAFAIKTFYVVGGNVCDFVLLNSSYQRSNLTVLGSSHKNGDNISKIRHVVDTVNKVSYLEFYYTNTSTVYSNPVGIELYSVIDGTRNTKWEVMNYELTQETVDGVTVYSTADLVTKDRNVVTNSDLEIKNQVFVENNLSINITSFGKICTLNILGKPTIPFPKNTWTTLNTKSIFIPRIAIESAEIDIAGNIFTLQVNTLGQIKIYPRINDVSTNLQSNMTFII